MVYRGKPSAACSSCRARRLKCDQKRPSCSSCLRAKRICTGYRDVAALSFHDQTAEVVEKANRRPQPQSEYNVSPCANASEIALSSDESAYDLFALQPVSVPIVDQGIPYVLTYHVGSAPRSVSGHLSFLPSIMQQEPSPAVMASINAMGLAALGNIHGSPHLIRAARQQYTIALSETNTALQDTITAKSDATLAAVLVLGLYEIITCQSHSLMVRWADHIEGAMALIKLRGSEQLRSPVGLELFTQLRGQYTLSNLYRKKATPAWLMVLSEETVAMRGPHQSSMEPFFKYLAKVSELCAQVGRKAKTPHETIQEALQLDAMLAAWALTVGPSWQYSVLDAAVAGDNKPSEQHIYGDYYHEYPEIGIAVMWNTYRLTRIVIHEVISAVCERLWRRSRGNNNELWATIRQSAAVTRQLAEEVCAGVPYFFGSARSNKSLIEASGLIRLHWTLFVASDCVGSTPRMKAWITSRLKEIGRRTGVQQALSMTNYLLGDVSLNWMKQELQAIDNFQEHPQGDVPSEPRLLVNVREMKKHQSKLNQ
ncbi:hypothetical protein ASPACDRAFT_44971 [Aspergillus aculeatus ATCC 16872]|uniref:Zn(2)-C6 fungal-type domain-containing protein n=1 Tax=Aspergillus aculeatus (strain ATCC 16872 / CBS 172.66 / WB 5094) TaxID=690307 RepID=A0A1L9WQL9_ASPA1|nr:uncharacterized protein ASPACDRAFT_44971 [Aspergillus aculeatus ATCC 16872]OJJ98461.1 hypothetical protein ASPACDRAFT_44971 [Aspergillus aculeatus ATCC 16872]